MNRNPIAKSLRSPHLQKQVIPDKRREKLDHALEIEQALECDGRDDHDRCCCECGNHFDGALIDDYCFDCWGALGLGEIDG